MSDPNLTLYYDFAADKRLAARIGPTLGITRTTTATFFNSSGLIETAASGVARFEYDAVTRINKGLLVEEARTNLCLQSETFNATPWTTLLTPIINKTALAPDGSNNATDLNDNDGAGFEAVVQQITIANDSADYTFSIYIKKTALGSAPTMGVNIVLIGGTNPGDLPIPRIFTDTGAIQDLQAGTNSRIVDAGDFWRLVTTVGNNATGNTIIEIQIYPATAANGLFPNDSAAVGINTVWGAQMEIGESASSYIPTTTVTVTRNADLVSTTDMSWYNIPEGTIYIAASHADADLVAGNPLAISDNSSSDRFFLRKNAGGTLTNFIVVSEAATAANLSATTSWSDGDNSNIAYCYKINDFELFTDGNRAGTGDQLGAVPVGITHLFVGQGFAAGQTPWNGHIAEIRYYNVRKDNTFLESLSNGIINEDSINLSSDLANSIARKIARPY